jgi:hypothetical protein
VAKRRCCIGLVEVQLGSDGQNTTRKPGAERNDESTTMTSIRTWRRGGVCVGFVEVQLGVMVEDELGKEKTK